MTVTGLNSDLYFSNNPIFITFSGISPNAKYIEYYRASFEGGASINPSRIYVYGQSSIKVDISPMVKASFPDVPHNTNYTTLTPFVVGNNWIRISLIVKEVLKDGSFSYIPAIKRTFVNGGIRTYESNQTTFISKPLVPCPTIPQWGGYPIDYYYFLSLIHI